MDVKKNKEKKKILCKSCKKEFININLHLKKSLSCLPSNTSEEDNIMATEIKKEEIIPQNTKIVQNDLIIQQSKGNVNSNAQNYY